MADEKDTKLAVKERLVLLGILPQTGNILTLKTVRELREDLVLTPEEEKEFEVKTIENGRIAWNETKAMKADKKSFKISDGMKEIIVKTLKGLDEKEKLSADHICLWDIFCK